MERPLPSFILIPELVLEVGIDFNNEIAKKRVWTCRDVSGVLLGEQRNNRGPIRATLFLVRFRRLKDWVFSANLFD